MNSFGDLKTVVIGAGLLAGASPAAAQVRLDRADPTITEQSLPTAEPKPQATAPAPAPAVTGPSVGAVPMRTPVISAVTVTGAEGVDPAVYAGVLAPVVGQELDQTELVALAGAIAASVRAHGYPFATASIEPQSMAGGVLRITIDQGKIDAVRVIGARNAAADAILVHALVTHAPVTQAALERALSLVGDLPGVQVKDSRFVQQDGFDILLVTIEQDRAAAYVQLDNRGNDEVGPVRSTVLATLRNLAAEGDEAGLIVAQTPVEPEEFAFLRGRYTAPVDASGSTLSVSASYGRSHPGATLAPLDVTGHSGDVTVAYQRALHRRRAASLWGSVELRAVSTQQTLAGRALRNDRIATVAGALTGLATVAGGQLHTELSSVVGLPLAGVTHSGDPRASRADGDARFVTVGYQLDWGRTLVRNLTVLFASAGQLASRPLLATAEIGIGGPAFGRAYDYAERTGDNGIAGSAELRFDLPRLPKGLVERAQLYAFVDGGVTGNYRGGPGGGTLVSAGSGIRLGAGRLSGMVEAAFPLNHDRFDTGDRRPRLSVRIARSF